MDLRVVKTEQLIRDAFFAITEAKGIEHVSVVELCHIAWINKSTFYRHYKDIIDLQEHIEGELINTFADDICEGPFITDDPKGFFYSMDQTFNGPKNCRLKELVFQGRYDVMFAKLEDVLKQRYQARGFGSFREYILLSYVFGGTFSVFQTVAAKVKDPDVAAIYAMLTEFTSCSLKNGFESTHDG